MPRSELMSWEGEPNYRWVKMYKGTRYRVTCQELDAAAFTKEGSLSLANLWWLRKKAELDTTAGNAVLIVDEAQRVRDLAREAHRGRQAVRELQAGLPALGASNVGQVRRAAEVAVRLGSIDDVEERAELLSAVLGESVPEAAREKGRTVKANGENFLAVVRADMRPSSYRELKAYVVSLSGTGDLLVGDMDVSAIDEALVEKMYLHLRNGPLSGGARKKRWGFFRRFVKYLWEKRLIEIPRNIGSFAFEVRARKIKTYSPKEVRTTLARLKPRPKLYALLGLNCGMTNVDIGGLTKDMVDLDGGTLTRKRVKTSDNANVPTVTYKLWPRTLELLRTHQSDHAELFLTSEDGTSLVSSRFEGDQVRRKDLIVSQFRRTKCPIPLKAFRSISATMIERHESYGRYTSHFLGHSPKSITAKHYAAPSSDLFDIIMLWLHGELFGECEKA